MVEVNEELVKQYLRSRRYLVDTDVKYHYAEVDEEEGRGRGSSDIDIIAIKMERGQIRETIMGAVNGWWRKRLTPSCINQELEGRRRLLNDTLSDERRDWLRDAYGLGDSPIRKVLFFSRKSARERKKEEAEEILAENGIEVTYLEDIIGEVIEKVDPTKDYGYSELLHTIKILKIAGKIE